MDVKTGVVIFMCQQMIVKLIENALNYSKELDRWSDFGIDLFELPISELGWNFLNVVLPELFSDEGVDCRLDTLLCERY